MKVLVIGRGGREHALAWKLAQSPSVEKVFCAPGNAGIANCAECIPIDEMDLEALAAFALANGVELTVVGPEAPLMAGIADIFSERGLTVFGPRREAAMIEGSKAFAKELMKNEGIPTAAYAVFRGYEEAKSHLLETPFPVVIKADGLAAGKGVTIAEDRKTAEEALELIMKDKVFGDAGASVVIEEYLLGEELTAMALVSGEMVVPLEFAQDHKPAFDGDKGPNTGGMGAYSPVPGYGEKARREILETVLIPAARGLARRGTPFFGLLYAGLMMTSSGPKVIEFNARFGDPETQVILPRLKTDLAEVLLKTAEGRLGDVSLEWKTESALCVVLTSGGYPGAYDTGKPISGLQEVGRGTIVFHSGTKADASGRTTTSGGRVVGITALGDSLSKAHELAYQEVERVSFDGCHYRRDIGARALRKGQQCG